MTKKMIRKNRLTLVLVRDLADVDLEIVEANAKLTEHVLIVAELVEDPRRYLCNNGLSILEVWRRKVPSQYTSSLQSVSVNPI